MCTVTFVPSDEQIFITSNRDEKSTRGKALTPAIYHFGCCSLLFPKDIHAGGTWIAAKNTGEAAVLLNGAFSPHLSRSSYRLSRGLVLLHILKDKEPLDCFKTYCCFDIEPFTLILFIQSTLFECRWDGEEKTVKLLPVNKAHIWSSATLYSTEVMQKRESWFTAWLLKNKQPSQQDLLFFHKYTGDGNKADDLFMNRNDELFTVSVTSFAISKNNIRIHYWDALDDVVNEEILTIKHVLQ